MVIDPIHAATAIETATVTAISMIAAITGLKAFLFFSVFLNLFPSNTEYNTLLSDKSYDLRQHIGDTPNFHKLQKGKTKRAHGSVHIRRRCDGRYSPRRRFLEPQQTRILFGENIKYLQLSTESSKQKRKKTNMKKLENKTKLTATITIVLLMISAFVVMINAPVQAQDELEIQDSDGTESTRAFLSFDYDMTSTQTNITIKMINSSLLDFAIDIPNIQINVKVSGEMDTIGFCNVTIPKELHLGDAWAIKINGVWTHEYVHPEKGNPWSCYTYENTTHTSLLFKYIHSDSPHQISFIGSETIPEFSSQTILQLSVITTAVVIIYRKHMTKKG